MPESITGKCDCGYTTEILRDPEIPKNVNLLRWNWCPSCEKKNGNQEWVERYSYKRKPRIKNMQTKLF